MAPLDHRQHFNSLDGLRGLAVLMVFCHHLCPFPAGTLVGTLCTTLWLGVDLFFVLSGFLITGVLYDTLGDPHFFSNFYMRRALRLLPVYCVVMGLVLAINTALGGSLTRWALPYFIYGSNIVRDLGLPIGLDPRLNVSHFWSLALEEQFYLLWPLCVYLARSRDRILLLCCAGAGLSVLLRALYLLHPAHFPLGTPYFELPTRLDGLLLGAAVAVLLRDERTRLLLQPSCLNMVFVLGLAALVVSFWQARHGSMFTPPMVRSGYLAAACTFAAAVGLAVRPGSWLARLCSHRVLRAFGRCSYGLYLIHVVPVYWYSLWLQRARAACPAGWQRSLVSLAVFGLYLGLCYLLASLSFYTLESYFLRRKRQFSYRDERPQAQSVAASTVSMSS